MYHDVSILLKFDRHVNYGVHGYISTLIGITLDYGVSTSG